MDYQELRSIADHDAWALIPGFTDTTHPLDIASLQNCVREWLSDVEKDYPPAEAMSRRQLADYFHTKIRRHLAEFKDGGRDDTVLYALGNTVRMRAISRRGSNRHQTAGAGCRIRKRHGLTPRPGENHARLHCQSTHL